MIQAAMSIESTQTKLPTGYCDPPQSKWVHQKKIIPLKTCQNALGNRKLDLQSIFKINPFSCSVVRHLPFINHLAIYLAALLY